MPRTPLLPEIRFFKFVEYDTNGGCWLWTGSLNKKGYGKFSVSRRQWTAAHRVSWIMTHGRRPSKFVLHRCDIPCCVNPDHLFEGDAKANAEDMVKKGRHGNTRKTVCHNGHALSGDNIRLSRGSRHCRICDVAYDRARRSKERLKREEDQSTGLDFDRVNGG